LAGIQNIENASHFWSVTRLVDRVKQSLQGKYFCITPHSTIHSVPLILSFIEEDQCVVPENTHTPTTEGIGNSGGVGGGQKPRKIQRRGGGERINYFPEGQLRFIPI